MIFYCTVSPGVRDAGTRCTSATRVVENMCNLLSTCEGLPTCQHIRAARIDEAVADAFLTALAPAELDALSRARRAQQQVDTALRASADRQLERKRYAAALAERQFNKVDPDNRLVAAGFERRCGSSSERGPGS